MADESARFALPWLQPGQAQKEMAHNEALARIDTVLHPAVQAVATDVPPVAPAVGQAWIVGAAPTGAWTGRAHALAAWTEGGWRFVAPVPGLHAWSVPDALWVRWTGTAWAIGEVRGRSLRIDGVQVVGGRRAAVPAPAGGNVVDVEARAAIASLIAALAGTD